ncbi:tyrosine-protein phosphatase [Lacticaseibacillus absianus]|uniref:tyrosine-protein phosphatase n=1 Tax=Lacticaseibacillus absianus TaxID=2729623 RepID=UPI0015CA3C98|nr:tyrosine-protein phosphatase [Lacticaseibacillus absianus]
MSIRLLDIHHGHNFRDLGGYRTQDGYTLRAHKLIRSGRLNELSERDLQYLADYGLRVDVDFRSPKERENAPDRLPAGVTYDFDPVLETDETKVSQEATELRATFATDPLAGFKNMLNVYANLVNQTHAQAAYRRFFDQLLANDAPDAALLFHCTAGKDRTGMGAVYVLSALGVDPLTIRRDYLASNQSLAAQRLKNLDAVRANGGSDELLASTRSLGRVADEYLDVALLAINREFGGMAQYLRDVLQLTRDQQRDLRRLYLE